MTNSNPYAAPQVVVDGDPESSVCSNWRVCSLICAVMALVGFVTYGYMVLRHPGFVESSKAALEWPAIAPRVVGETTFLCFVTAVVTLVIDKIPVKARVKRGSETSPVPSQIRK